jgi:hypothetical protein
MCTSRPESGTRSVWSYGLDEPLSELTVIRDPGSSGFEGCKTSVMLVDAPRTLLDSLMPVALSVCAFTFVFIDIHTYVDACLCVHVYTYACADICVPVFAETSPGIGSCTPCLVFHLVCITLCIIFLKKLFTNRCVNTCILAMQIKVLGLNPEEPRAHTCVGEARLALTQQHGAADWYFGNSKTRRLGACRQVHRNVQRSSLPNSLRMMCIYVITAHVCIHAYVNRYKCLHKQAFTEI